MKNGVAHCSFAIGDADCTPGFVECRTPQPKTLMKGYELNASTACPLELVLRGKRRSKIFDEIVYGDEVAYRKCYDRIKSFADSEGAALNPVFHGF